MGRARPAAEPEMVGAVVKLTRPRGVAHRVVEQAREGWLRVACGKWFRWPYGLVPAETPTCASCLRAEVSGGE